MSASKLRWMVCAAVAAVVIGANLASGQLNKLFLALPGIDKIAHVVFHCALFACVRAIARSRGATSRRQTLTAVIVGSAVAVVDETVQGLVASRSVEAQDLVANAAGISLGWVLTARPRRALAVSVSAAALLAASFVTFQTYSRLIDYSRALRHSQQRDFVMARVHFRRALEAGIRTPALFNELGWVEIESGIGDPAKAVEYAKTALDMQPESADILDTYGWALHHAGRSLEALAPLLKAFEKSPRMFCIHYHLGAVYLALNHPEKAETHFRAQLTRSDTREAALAQQALERMRVARDQERQ